MRLPTRETGSNDSGLSRRLLTANVSTCVTAVLVHAVNCGRGLLKWHVGGLHWPLLVLFLLLFAVAVTLTGLSLLAAFQRPGGGGRRRLIPIVALGAVLPLGSLIALVAGMSSVMKWLDAQ